MILQHTLIFTLGFQAQKYIQSLPFMPPQDLEKNFRGANPHGKVLQWISGQIISHSQKKKCSALLCASLFFVSIPVQPLTCWSACWCSTVMGESQPARLFPTRTSRSTMIQTMSPRPKPMTKRLRAKIVPWRSGKVKQTLTWLNKKAAVKILCKSSWDVTGINPQ